MIRRLIPLLLLCPGTLFAQSGILDASRYEQWARANVGVLGGIPSSSYTQCVTAACNTVTSAGSASTAAQINAALHSAPSNTYVLLPAGTYNSLGASGIIFGGGGNTVNKNVVLRGAGANQTFLVPTAIGVGCANGRSANICITGAPTSIFPGGNNTMPPCGGVGSNNCGSWTAGFAQGATSITVSGLGSAGVLNGDYITVDQGNTNASDNGGFTVCNVAYCSFNPTIGNGRFTSAPFFEADHQQWVQVTAGCASLCTGAGPFTLTIAPGLYGIDWNQAQPVFGIWFTKSTGYLGLENFSIDNNTAGSQGNVSFYNCANCWMKNIRSMNSIRSHVTIFDSPRVEIRDSYIFRTQNGTNQSYGIEYGEPAGSDILVENNIFQQVTSPLIGGGANGLVVGYNFAISDNYNPSSYLQGFFLNHDADNTFILAEGNVFPSIGCDADHGSGGLNTVFRNWLNGLDWNQGVHPSNQTQPIDLDAMCRGYNVIGNVMGTPTYHTNYQTAVGDVSTAACNQSIYILGYSNGGVNCTNTGSVGPDSVVKPSTMRWGNYDTATATVRWDSTESSPGAVAWINANSTPANHILPASFYLSSKPSFFGSLPFPLIGPDITSGNGGFYSSGTFSQGICQVGHVAGGATCASTVGGFANINAAMNCYLNVMGGPADGSGLALTFDASLCYAAGSPAVSLSPTSLAFGNQVLNVASSPQNITLTNTGTATLTITSITRTGTDPGDYAIGGTCGASLAPAANCFVSVTFTPVASGSRPASLTFTTNASTSPDVAPLSGTGIAVTSILLGNVKLGGTAVVH